MMAVVFIVIYQLNMAVNSGTLRTLIIIICVLCLGMALASIGLIIYTYVTNLEFWSLSRISGVTGLVLLLIGAALFIIVCTCGIWALCSGGDNTCCLTTFAALMFIAFLLTLATAIVFAVWPSRYLSTTNDQKCMTKSKFGGVRSSSQAALN